jgi:hypothetical protein
LAPKTRTDVQLQNCVVGDHHVMVSQWLMTAKASI